MIYLGLTQGIVILVLSISHSKAHFNKAHITKTTINRSINFQFWVIKSSMFFYRKSKQLIDIIFSCNYNILTIKTNQIYS